MNETEDGNHRTGPELRREPFATFGVLDAERFMRADFDWQGKITLRFGIADGTETAATTLAARLDLTLTQRRTKPREPLYPEDRTDLVWVDVVYTGRYAGHEVGLTAGWIADQNDDAGNQR